jgi:replicative DNA helicase
MSKIAHFEKSIIGQCLNGKLADIMSMGLTSQMFTDHDYAKIYEIAVKQHMSGRACDMTIIFPELEDNKLATDKLVEASFQTMATLNLQWIVSIIVNDSILRDKLRAIHGIYTEACARDPLVPFPIDEKLSNILQINNKGSGVDRLHDDYLVGFRDRLSDDIESGGVKALSTGIRSLNRQLGGGLRPPRVITIAGRPGSGKTALATNIAMHCSINGGHPLYVTIELGTDEIVERLICTEMGINTTDMSGRTLSEADITKALIGTEHLSKRRFSVCSNTAGSWENAVMHINYNVKFKGVDCVFIDYIQQFHLDGKRLGLREELNIITGQVKALAKKLNIPIVIVAQLNRDIEKRIDKEPLMSDLKESGSIEADSDAVMILYWDESNDGERNLMLKIVKNRQGSEGDVKIHHNFSTNKFWGD